MGRISRSISSWTEVIQLSISHHVTTQSRDWTNLFVLFSFSFVLRIFQFFNSEPIKVKILTPCDCIKINLTRRLTDLRITKLRPGRFWFILAFLVKWYLILRSIESKFVASTVPSSSTDAKGLNWPPLYHSRRLNEDSVHDSDISPWWPFLLSARWQSAINVNFLIWPQWPAHNRPHVLQARFNCHI